MMSYGSDPLTENNKYTKRKYGIYLDNYGQETMVKIGMICIIPREDFVVVKAINVVAKEDQGWNFKALKRSFTENKTTKKKKFQFLQK